MSHLRLSPRNLGQLLIDPFCPRCFWYQVQMNFRLPFDRPMPGIMFHLDHFEKRIVEEHFAVEDAAPEWLRELHLASPIDFPAKMTQEFPEYDITMVGMPDAVFLKKNGKLCLVDFKTAICHGTDDPFMPIYETQLMGYTHLLESNNVGTVDSAALVYFENKAKELQSHPLELLTDDGFFMPFGVQIHEVEIDRSALEPLLIRIRKVADEENPPTGLDKCKDCAKLQSLLDKEQKMRDYQEFCKRQRSHFRNYIYPKLSLDRQMARVAWKFDWDPDDSEPFVLPELIGLMPPA